MDTDPISAVSRATDIPVLVHLMAQNPEQHVALFSGCGANTLVFHTEATSRPIGLTSAIRNCGMKAGLAMNPATPPDVLELVGSMLDVVVVMAVEPGFSGQRLIPQTYDKLRKIREISDRVGSKAIVEVDDGIGPDNARTCLDSGADVLVAGKLAIFRDDIPQSFDEQYGSFISLLEI